MDIFPKFIVEDGIIKLGRVTFHKQLANNPDNVKGGGFWEWDRENNKLLLYGESHDFGPVSLITLAQAVINTQGIDYRTPGKQLITKNTTLQFPVSTRSV